MYIHNAPSEQIRYELELVIRLRQQRLEGIMTTRHLLLPITDGSDGLIVTLTNGTLKIAVYLIQTSLMIGVLAQEVHNW